MSTTRRRVIAVLILAALAVAAVLLLTRPDPGHEFFAEYRDLYPGTPTLAEAAFVAKAEQICDAGAPASWWDAWDNGAPARADLWNLAIAHVCPEYAGHVVSVAP
ncbi:hypothetical protein [Actinotalea fermentans]|uniref:DUF732 domain-containing protein n=1 Tax=Actinotalea fermentans TaxID=43671 RepID=A0A511YU45_9CELL|nr:hypothetical protein [Actinotalea fermentans]KGM17169.1 hypothetical protein N867_09180 [Actinotalea fermentans ATCC 43279 = JCM 9966 = DSM 3133]GEN78717.1 hypothetical protein AFE02nite_04510 [Actinotalea fermentans]